MHVYNIDVCIYSNMIMEIVNAKSQSQVQQTALRKKNLKYSFYYFFRENKNGHFV